MLNHMNFSSPDTARRCRLDSFLSVHAFNRCLANSILSTPILPWSYWQYFSTRVQSLSRQRFSLSTRHALPSQLLSGCLCLINSYQPSVASSPVVVPLLAFSRCRAVGWKGLFALFFAFSPDEWTRSGNESVAQEMDFVERSEEHTSELQSPG